MLSKASLLFILLLNAPAFAQSEPVNEDADIASEVEKTKADILADEPNVPPVSSRVTTDQPPPMVKEESSSGEKIFDWKKYPNQTQVPHPFAEKGLIRIGKDRTYYYKVNEGDHNKAWTFQAGTINPVNLRNPDSPDPVTSTYEHNYQQGSSPVILVTREWTLWRTPIGKIGLRGGSGIFVAQGHGHFVNSNFDKTPKEVLTFVGFPNSVGAIYRMQFTHKQLFVPYAEGGGMAWTFTEFRDDKKGPKFGAAFAAYAAGGLAFNLTYFDYLARVQLNREYGIGMIYLLAEFRRFQGLSNRFDFSSNYINGGLLMEY